MKISEYISHLEKIMAEHGDVDVQSDYHWGRASSVRPEISYALILKGRESKPRFWCSFDDESRKGDAVCRVY